MFSKGKQERRECGFMRVYIYAWTEANTSEEAMQTQLDKCRQKALQLRGKDIREFVDSQCGAIESERPALAELRQVLQKAAPDYVVCLRPDRLAEKTAQQLVILDEIRKTGAQPAFCDFNCSWCATFRDPDTK